MDKTHHVNDATNMFICPITELETDHVWSDHDLPGVFNSCKHCTDEDKSPGQMLHELQKKREVECL